MRVAWFSVFLLVLSASAVGGEELLLPQLGPSWRPAENSGLQRVEPDAHWEMLKDSRTGDLLIASRQARSFGTKRDDMLESTRELALSVLENSTESAENWRHNVLRLHSRSLTNHDSRSVADRSVHAVVLVTIISESGDRVLMSNGLSFSTGGQHYYIQLTSQRPITDDLITRLTMRVIMQRTQ